MKKIINTQHSRKLQVVTLLAATLHSPFKKFRFGPGRGREARGRPVQFEQRPGIGAVRTPKSSMTFSSFGQLIMLAARPQTQLIWLFSFSSPIPYTTPTYYSSFHLIFHYPNITLNPEP